MTFLPQLLLAILLALGVGAAARSAADAHGHVYVALAPAPDPGFAGGELTIARVDVHERGGDWIPLPDSDAAVAQSAYAVPMRLNRADWLPVGRYDAVRLHVRAVHASLDDGGDVGLRGEFPITLPTTFCVRPDEVVPIRVNWDLQSIAEAGTAAEDREFAAFHIASAATCRANERFEPHTTRIVPMALVDLDPGVAG
jgi:hypothetical protein